MKDLEANRENLFKYGYCVVRNLLSSKEIEYCKTAIEKVSAKMKADVVIGIHNHKECWNFIAHKKLLNITTSPGFTFGKYNKKFTWLRNTLFICWRNKTGAKRRLVLWLA